MTISLQQLKKTSLIILLAFSAVSCEELFHLTQQRPTSIGLTQQEIASGMKESLIVGARNAVGDLAKEGGFYNNQLIRIPFPPEAERMATTLRSAGMGKLVDEFVETLNRSAEVASELALDVFVGAVRQMSFQNVMDIFMGPEDAATQYLIRTTSDSLTNAFMPPVRQAIDQVELTAVWNPLVSAYNKIPFTTQVNPNLEEYVTEKALQGLFFTVAKEEALIRENPQARTTELLRRVFGDRDRRMQSENQN